MTVSVLLEGVLKEGQVDKFIELCEEAYKVPGLMMVAMELI